MDIQADLRGPDLPVVAVPAEDDARGFEAVEHLLDVGRDAVLVLGDQVELAADQVEESADRRGALLGDPLLPLGRGRVGAFEGQLQRADQPAELAEPAVAEAEVFLVDDLDLAAADDRRLVDRLQVVLAEVGLEGDVDGLGQVLERGLDADLPRVDLHGHVAEAAGLPRRDRAAVSRARRDRHADGDSVGPVPATGTGATVRAGWGRGAGAGAGFAAGAAFTAGVGFAAGASFGADFAAAGDGFAGAGFVPGFGDGSGTGRLPGWDGWRFPAHLTGRAPRRKGLLLSSDHAADIGRRNRPARRTASCTVSPMGCFVVTSPDHANAPSPASERTPLARSRKSSRR